MTHNSRDTAHRRVTIHDAYHALDDYLVDRAGTFDLSAGLEKLLGTATTPPDTAAVSVSTASTPAATPRPDPMTVPSPRGRAPVRRRRGFVDLLARIAGAQPDVLAGARTDRVKFATVGGVLLTTAAVAGVSATFALSVAVGLPVAVAAVAGVLWAMVILNLDRMLIVSVRRQPAWWRNLFVAVPRLVLAVVIGSIVSVPLVLGIFQPEINSELRVVHSENLIAAQETINRQFADVEQTQAKVDQLQAVASGQSQPSVSSDPDVVAAQKQVQDAQAAYDKAAAEAQCELAGSCGTRRPGIGEAYRLMKAMTDQTQAALDDATAKLNDAIARAQAKISGSVASNSVAAKAELANLVPMLEKRMAERADAQSRLNRDELNDDGLLARLQALDRLSSDRPSLQAAQLALFLLFVLIEVLPVLARLASMLGPPGLYDRLLDAKEANLRRLARLKDEKAIEFEQLVVAEQIRRGLEANRLLVAAQTEVAQQAIQAWENIAMSRADEELARWYHQLALSNVAALSDPDTAGLPSQFATTRGRSDLRRVSPTSRRRPRSRPGGSGS